MKKFLPLVSIAFLGASVALAELLLFSQIKYTFWLGLFFISIWIIKKYLENKKSVESTPHKVNERKPSDRDISDRKIASRYWVLLVWVITLPLLSTFGTEWFVSIFFEKVPQLISSVSYTVGFALGIGGLFLTIDRWFLIRNPTTGMFLTIDTLQSLIGGDSVNVSYGPGTHICFPWEERLAENNISLEEATNEFSTTVQCLDGILKVNGVFWARPDIKKPVEFLSGVGAFTEDMEGLIIARIASLFSQKNVMQAIGELKSLNESLKTLTTDQEDVEKNFGIQLGAVVIKQLLPSEELQRTISAKAEASAIKDGTLSLLGADSWSQVQEWLKDKTLTQADISLARDRYLSISGNLEGMEIKRNEIDISLHGLDKDVAEAIAKALTSPAAAALAAKAVSKK